MIRKRKTPPGPAGGEDRSASLTEKNAASYKSAQYKPQPKFSRSTEKSGLGRASRSTEARTATSSKSGAVTGSRSTRSEANRRRQPLPRSEVAAVSRYAQIHEAATNDSRLGDGAFRTYLFLLTYMGQKGCFPKVSTIARKRGLHRATVSEHLNAAFKPGYLVIEPQYHPDGRQGSNRYTVPKHLAISPDAATNRASPYREFPIPPIASEAIPPSASEATPLTESINKDSPLRGSDARARRGRGFFRRGAAWKWCLAERSRPRSATALHRKGNREWISFPSREWVDREGNRKFTPRGEFINHRDAHLFREAALEAVRLILGEAAL
jgi:Helix-turn-helix domain